MKFLNMSGVQPRDLLDECIRRVRRSPTLSSKARQIRRFVKPRLSEVAMTRAQVGRAFHPPVRNNCFIGQHARAALLLGATTTEGYRLYKRNLLALGCIEQVYDASSGFAYSLASREAKSKGTQ